VVEELMLVLVQEVHLLQLIQILKVVQVTLHLFLHHKEIPVVQDKLVIMEITVEVEELLVLV
jgi:hypothetical protein